MEQYVASVNPLREKNCGVLCTIDTRYSVALLVVIKVKYAKMEGVMICPPSM